MKLFTVNWKYSTEYDGGPSEGLSKFIAKRTKDNTAFDFIREDGSLAGRFAGIEDFIYNEFPENDAFAGGYYDVKVIDENGSVLFSR